MKFYYTFLISFLLLATSLQTQALQQLDQIIAIINDNVITEQQLQQRISDFKRQMKAQGTTIPNQSIMQKQVLERLIVDEVQLQIAKSQGLQIDDITLNKMLTNMANNNKTNLDDLRKSIIASGIAFETFREQTRKEMIIRQLQKRMVLDRIQVSAQEIDQFLDQQKQSGAAANDKYHIAHILIATPEAATPENINNAYDKAEKVLAHLKDGQAFDEVAQRFSEGRQALKGGDLGWRSAAQLPAIFLDALKPLKKGGVSSPLRSAGGFHIIKLIDKQTQQYIVKQTLARHILIRSDAITNDEQVRIKMNTIKKRLDKGEDFAALANEFSQDPGSKSRGGDLGWTSPGNFVPRFEKVMNSLSVNQMSEPFKSRFGWHIIQVQARRQQDETDQLIRGRAHNAIKQRKADEQLQLWIRRIRDEAYVEYRNQSGS